MKSIWVIHWRCPQKIGILDAPHPLVPYDHMWQTLWTNPSDRCGCPQMFNSLLKLYFYYNNSLSCMVNIHFHINSKLMEIMYGKKSFVHINIKRCKATSGSWCGLHFCLRHHALAWTIILQVLRLWLNCCLIKTEALLFKFIYSISRWIIFFIVVT